MLIDMCVLVWLLACNPGMRPDMWEEWWHSACVLDMQPDMWSQGAAAHASGAMRSDTRAATNLKLIGWCLL